MMSQDNQATHTSSKGILMQKTDCTTLSLEHGIMRVYTHNGLTLHAYQTCDPIDDEVFIVEDNGRAFIIEYPCFYNNIEELTRYITDNNLEVEGIFAAYHMAGASFLPNVTVYATPSADVYGHGGGGRALIDNFAQVFGDAFDHTLPNVTNNLEAGTLSLAGIDVTITPNNEAYDIEIPALNAMYTHMLGHDCHSIVPGYGAADALIAQLEGFLARGYDLVLTAHYTPESLKDVQTKIDYLKNVKKVAATCTSADEFKTKLEQTHPDYTGLNYLDMTASFFFPDHA